jgi:cytochrome c553
MIRTILPVVLFSFLLGFEAERTADPGAGKAKAEACASCHGENGISGDPSVPNLAGQRSPYFVGTLKEFKRGIRKNPVMSPIAAGLSRTEMENLAAYYANLPPMRSKGDPAFVAKGKVGYFFCQECHGSLGAGNESNPRLAGQHPDYMLAQLQAYKKGTRKSPVMSGIAAALAEEDMKGLAEYLATLK